MVRESMRLDTERPGLLVYLSTPVSASAAIVSPVRESLAVVADVIASDPFSMPAQTHPPDPPGLHPHAASGPPPAPGGRC